MKTFILLIGLPGAGKSTWTKKYQQEHQNTFIIASDEMRKELFGHVQDFRDEAKVWATVDERIIAYGQSKDSLTVIVDAGNRTNAVRKHYYEIAKDYDEHILVYLKRELDTLLAQNKKRSKDRIVKESVIARFNEEFEEPSEEIIKLYDVVLL